VVGSVREGARQLQDPVPDAGTHAESAVQSITGPLITGTAQPYTSMWNRSQWPEVGSHSIAVWCRKVTSIGPIPP
jgi:hypothetical protein